MHRYKIYTGPRGEHPVAIRSDLDVETTDLQLLLHFPNGRAIFAGEIPAETAIDAALQATETLSPHQQDGMHYQLI